MKGGAFENENNYRNHEIIINATRKRKRTDVVLVYAKHKRYPGSSYNFFFKYRLLINSVKQVANRPPCLWRNEWVPNKSSIFVLLKNTILWLEINKLNNLLRPFKLRLSRPNNRHRETRLLTILNSIRNWYFIISSIKCLDMNVSTAPTNFSFTKRSYEVLQWHYSTLWRYGLNWLNWPKK